MGFFRQEYWSGLPCPLPGALPNPETELQSLMSLALAGSFVTTSATWEHPLPPPPIHAYPTFPCFLPQNICNATI